MHFCYNFLFVYFTGSFRLSFLFIVLISARVYSFGEIDRFISCGAICCLHFNNLSKIDDFSMLLNLINSFWIIFVSFWKRTQMFSTCRFWQIIWFSGSEKRSWIQSKNNQWKLGVRNVLRVNQTYQSMNTQLEAIF